MLIEAWPCPFMATEGIQNCRGFEAVGAETLPDWISEGVPPRLPSWYQRAPARSPEALDAAAEFMRRLWAVQRLISPSGSLPILASKKRSSRASSPPMVPWAGTPNGVGVKVAGMVTVMLGEIVGVPPGSLILRTSRRLKVFASGPTTYPVSTPGTVSVAGCGEAGPCPEVIRLRKAVATIGPPPITEDFLITKRLVFT